MGARPAGAAACGSLRRGPRPTRWCVRDSLCCSAQPWGWGAAIPPWGARPTEPGASLSHLGVGLVPLGSGRHGPPLGTGALWPPRPDPLPLPVCFAANSLSLSVKGLVRGPGDGWWHQEADVPSCQMWDDLKDLFQPQCFCNCCWGCRFLWPTWP